MAESESEERMCIPESLSFDTLNLILIAYLKAGADKKAVSYRDASVRSGISHVQISVNNKFFVYSGFLLEEGKGLFRLTEGGAKYAQLLDWGRLEEAKSVLRAILSECSLVRIAVDYVGLNKEVARDDLERKLGSIAEVSKARRFTVGIKALTDMLAFSGLLHEENNMIRRGVIEVEPQVETRPTPLPKKAFEVPDIVLKPPTETTIPISLTINVTDTTDVQKLREILRAIREEPFKEKETPD
jgi:hypothetical protein